MNVTFGTFGESLNDTPYRTKRRIPGNASIVRYSEKTLKGIRNYPGLLPQVKEGDILLLFFNDDIYEDLKEILNLSHSKFDFIDIDSN
jgi:hypothetical protein